MSEKPVVAVGAPDMKNRIQTFYFGLLLPFAVIWISSFAQAQSPVATEQAPTSAPITFATAVLPGEKVAPGNFVRTIRPFNEWSLNCDQLLGVRRVCTLETSVRGSDGAEIVWRLANLSNGLLAMVVRTPRDLDEAYGLHYGAEGMEKTEKGLKCGQSFCVLVAPFGGKTAEFVLGAATVTIGYSRGGRPQSANVPMAGFKEALDAIGKPETPCQH
jgi:invasion protein IalB